VRLTLTSPYIHLHFSLASPPSSPSPLIPLDVLSIKLRRHQSKCRSTTHNDSRDVCPASIVDTWCYQSGIWLYKLLSEPLWTSISPIRFGTRPTHPPIFIIQFLYPSSTPTKEIDHARQSYTSSHICRLCCRGHRILPKVPRPYCRSCSSSLASDCFGVKTAQHFRILYGAFAFQMCHRLHHASITRSRRSNGLGLRIICVVHCHR
jgi:hypothetical protein